MNGSMAPSAPTNFRVKNTNSTNYLITMDWDPPVRAGSAGIINYEVSLDDGLTWIPVGAAVTYQYSGIIADEVFVVRAVSDLRTAAELSLESGAYAVGYTGRGAWAINPAITYLP